MANAEHLEILKSGVEKWNKWREENKGISPDLTGSILPGVDLSHADLRGVYLFESTLINANLTWANLNKAFLNNADLTGANLSAANLCRAACAKAKFIHANLHCTDLGHAELIYANLTGANLSGAVLIDANLMETNMTRANLSDAEMAHANLSGANLTGANLQNTNLRNTSLVQTDLTNAVLEGAKIYGISVWDIKKEGAIQKNLVITLPNQPDITVDNLDVAQFIYLMLNNQNIRDVIDIVAKKAVLILGRFTGERKAVVDAIKEELRKHDYLPILFDFEKPASRDLTETVSILAKMSRFVIADLTDAKSLPQELSYIIPFTPSLPVLPIILEGQREYAMFEHFKPYPWVLPLHAYQTPEAMLSEIVKGIIEPAERKVNELRGVKPPTL